MTVQSNIEELAKALSMTADEYAEVVQQGVPILCSLLSHRVKSRGVRVTELADTLGVSRQYLHRVLNKGVPPSMPIIEGLVAAGVATMAEIAVARALEDMRND